LTQLSPGLSTGDPRPINIRKAWVDALNAFDSSANTTVLASYISKGSSQYKTSLRGTDWNGYPIFGQALLLSTALTNDISIIGLEVGKTIVGCRDKQCIQGPYYSERDGYVIYNDTNEETVTACGLAGLELLHNHSLASQPMLSFKKPSRAVRDSEWTKLSFPVFSYDYGWGFDAVTVRIAAAVLVLHACIIVIHVAYMLLKSMDYNYMNSFEELLVLAMKSRSSDVPAPTSLGWGGGRKAWDRKIAVRQIFGDGARRMDRLEIVMGAKSGTGGKDSKEEEDDLI